MTLSPEAAALLRAALKEAENAETDMDSFLILARTVDSLLKPLPEAEFTAQLAVFRRPVDEQDIDF